MGIVAHQDFKVINLWEVDVSLVFEQDLTALLPFVPVLKGGQDETVLSRAVIRLRADENIAEMEPLLAFFASFVLSSDVVQRIMRWDMTILRESPWYNEIVKEGLEQGLQQGLQQGIKQGQEEMLLRVLVHRFGDLDPELVARIRSLGVDQLRQLVDVALDAPSLETFKIYLDGQA
jgi:predicted transposase YdaD